MFFVMHHDALFSLLHYLPGRKGINRADDFTGLFGDGASANRSSSLH
jgi:hypothetical protein